MSMRRKVIYQRIELDDLVYDSKDIAILEGLAVGKTRPELAKELFLSKRTIDSRVDSMASALLVTGQVAVVVKAIALGIITNPYQIIQREKF